MDRLMTAGLWGLGLVMVAVASAGAEAPEKPPPHKVDHLPFIQAFRQAETRAQKIQHLRSWNHTLGPQNGLTESEALFLEAFLVLYIFFHVDDNGVLNCQALGDNLDESLYHRYESETSTYSYSLPSTMFNLIVDDLCPALAGESPHRRREQ